jgi:hypothetical protein
VPMPFELWAVRGTVKGVNLWALACIEPPVLHEEEKEKS